MTPAVSSLLIVFGLWLTMAFLCCSGAGRKQPDRPALTPAQRAEAQAAKDKACNTVSRLTRAGGFTKVEAGYSGVTHAYVDRGFYQIAVDAKREALQWVAMCYIDINKKDQPGLVIIHDGYSGKRIGTYDFASGLDLD